MLSGDKIAKLRADIQQLEKFRDGCTDSGIRQLVESRIEQQKKKLVETPA